MDFIRVLGKLVRKSFIRTINIQKMPYPKKTLLHFIKNLKSQRFCAAELLLFTLLCTSVLGLCIFAFKCMGSTATHTHTLC